MQRQRGQVAANGQVFDQGYCIHLLWYLHDARSIPSLSQNLYLPVHRLIPRLISFACLSNYRHLTRLISFLHYVHSRTGWRLVVRSVCSLQASAKKYIYIYFPFADESFSRLCFSVASSVDAELTMSLVVRGTKKILMTTSAPIHLPLPASRPRIRTSQINACLV